METGLIAMMVTTADRTIDRAIENIERLAADAIAELRKESERLTSRVTAREVEVGIAQAGAELAYAALIACKSPARPDYIELAIDTKGIHNDNRERVSARTSRAFVRRIKDRQ